MKILIDDIVTVLLPYLTTLSKKCIKLSTWFPNAAVEELKRRLDQPLIYVRRIFFLKQKTGQITCYIVGKFDSPFIADNSQ